MKRTMPLVALASALSLSLSAFAHGTSSSQNQSDWSKSTRRVESMNDQQSPANQQSQSPDLVKQAQEKLGAMGKDVGTPDGQMNAQTQEALMQYQQENGLSPTGQLDPQTIAALDLSASTSD
jgi:peptidoglycan hydrolase-like protein with peptidoglycan-binding domain